VIVKNAFTKGYPFNLQGFKEDYSFMERRENWFYRLLVRLRLRKPRRVPGAYDKLLEPGLKRDFELAYRNEPLNDFLPEKRL